MYLGGPAGSGKTYYIDTIIKPHFTNDKGECRLLVLGSTHTANLNILGDGTVDAIRAQGTQWMRKNINNYDAILVDEVSILSLHHYQWFVRKWKALGKMIIMVGDFNQCKIDARMDGFDKHPFFEYLTDNNRIILRHNKRDKSGIIQELSNKVLRREKVLHKIQEQRDTFCGINLVWTNYKRRKINLQVNTRYNKERKKRRKANGEKTKTVWFNYTEYTTTYIKGREVPTNEKVNVECEIMKGCRLICKKPKTLDSFVEQQKRGIFNNELYIYVKSTKDKHFIERKVIIMTDGVKTVEPQRIELKRGDTEKNEVDELNRYFKLGWALTVHSVQGHSISENISIHEAHTMFNRDISVLYTAITRATDAKYLHLGTKYVKGCIVGHIYKITLNNGRHYIGQTTRTNPDDRRQEHLDDYVKGTNKLYTEMRRVGIDGFKFKVLLRKYYPSFAALDRQESLFIEEYNTIEDGLNTLLPPKREL